MRTVHPTSASTTSTASDLGSIASTRIVINGAIALRGVSGTARIVDHIEQGLISGGFSPLRVSPPGVGGKSRLLNALRAARWDLWQAGGAARDGSILISPCNTGLARPSCPHLLWMHDTMVLDHPEWFDPGFYRYARLLFGLSARHCSRLITASQHTAARIAHYWPDVPQPEVIPWPVVVKAAQPRQLPPRPWQVIMVAATEAHKNHVGAIDAVARARGSLGNDVHLTLIGPAGRSEDEVMSRAREADPDRSWIRRLIGISELELEQTYRSAWVVIQPSFDEGFCLPLLEATAHGTPTVHSGRGSMPEVASCVNANSVRSEVLSECIVALAAEQRYLDASRSAIADCHRMSPARFTSELSRLVTAAVAAQTSGRHWRFKRLAVSSRETGV
jgi:glycosyltransferase involved in cell wall biosynthesis